MLTLITAVPGSGKTLYVVSEIAKLNARGKLKVVGGQGGMKRPVYSRGIDWRGAGVGLAEEITDEQCKSWPEWAPDGALIIVDEAQQVWKKSADPKLGVPKELEALETHRHRGIDIWFITQHAMNVHIHIRRLVGRHLHLSRSKSSIEASSIFEWNRYMEIGDDGRFPPGGDKKLFKFPKENYALYKSAEVHTHKFKFPLKALALPVVIGVVGICIYSLYQTLFGEEEAATVAEPVEAPADQPKEAKPAVGPKSKPVLTAEQLVASYVPRIPDQPQSAPRYDELNQPVVMPKASACVYRHTSKTCHCWTQQATRLTLDRETCLSHVAYGWFDDTRLPPDIESDRPGPAERARADRPPPAGLTTTSESLPSRDLSQPYAGLELRAESRFASSSKVGQGGASHLSAQRNNLAQP